MCTAGVDLLRTEALWPCFFESFALPLPLQASHQMVGSRPPASFPLESTKCCFGLSLLSPHRAAPKPKHLASFAKTRLVGGLSQPG